MLINHLLSGMILQVAPSQDSSDHQDYEPFLGWDPNQNLHFPHPGRGPHPTYRQLFVLGPRDYMLNTFSGVHKTVKHH